MLCPENNQKYCAGCEAWHYDLQETKNQKFGELVPLYSNKTDLMLKESNLTKKYRKKSFDYVLNQSVVRSLQSKLFYLSTILSSENNLQKIKEILSTMNICLENIRMAACLEQSLRPPPS